MNFDLGSDELALRDGIRELCAKRFPMERVRKGFDRDGWRALGEAGVFSLRLPEDRGGVGLGMTEAAIVFQELGRFLVPGPLVATHLAAGLVDGAADGEVVVTVVDGPLVEHAADADAALALGERVLVVNGSVDGEDLEPLDPLTPVRSVEGRPYAGLSVPVDIDSLRRDGTVLTAALLAGIAAAATDQAVAFAKDRIQFDKPIGSFQAVKHMCADMFVRAEVARAAVDAAAVIRDDPKADPISMIAGAKLLAGDAAVANSKACIQVHGGMGFTWEADPHLYLKRAAVLSTDFGSADHYAEVVASRIT